MNHNWINEIKLRKSRKIIIRKVDSGGRISYEASYIAKNNEVYMGHGKTPEIAIEDFMAEIERYLFDTC